MFAAGRILPWHQTQPGRELAPTAEAARFYHRGGDGCGDDRADRAGSSSPGSRPRLRLERGLQGRAREYVAAFHRGLAVVQDAMTMLEIPRDESGGAPGRARECDGGNT